jgi:hypothetical protein
MAIKCLKKLNAFSVLSTFIFIFQEEKEGKQVSSLEILWMKDGKKSQEPLKKKRF